MPIGLIIIMAVAHGARSAAQPAETAGARCKPPGQIPGLAAADAAAVSMMNAFAAHDPGAADPLARPGDDGAPCSGGPPPSQVAGAVPDMIATAHEPVEARPPPAAPPQTSGGRGAAAGSPGLRPPVTASRAEMIAASSGRARQQRTPALTGVG